MAVGNSPLRGAQVPTCQPDLLSRGICCLLVAWIWDVVERLPKLGWSSDYCPSSVLAGGHQWYCQGQPEEYRKWLQSSGGDGQGYGDPSGILLLVRRRGVRWRALIEELVAGVVLVTGFLFLWSWDPIWGVTVYLWEMGSTSFRRGRVSLSVEWLTR